MTPALARFSATLIEPAIGELLRKHELTLERVFEESADVAGATAGGAGDADGGQAAGWRRRGWRWMPS